MKKCIHCHHLNESDHIELNWDAVCSECGSLTWIKSGQLRLVRIKRLSEFGVFVDVGGGTEGLIHVSELATTRVQHPSDVVNVDDLVTAIVLRVDTIDKRIGLSIRRVSRDVDELGQQ